MQQVVQHYTQVLLPLQQTILSETLKFYNGMLVGVYELLLAKQTQVQTARQYVTANRDFWLAWTDLERAAGGGLALAATATAAPAPQTDEVPNGTISSNQSMTITSRRRQITMTTRRQILKTGAALLTGGAVSATLRQASAAEQHAADNSARQFPRRRDKAIRRSSQLNGGSLPWKMDNGVKVFHLIAEPIKREFAPGMVVNCWGYNGSTPGPTIEAVEGDRVRILVTNNLPEHTTIHWHGIFLPNGMDGVGGLTQPHIKPGETYVYEFTLRQNGSFMYHPHADEMVQAAMGMMGMFIIHPKAPREPRVDRDFCFMLHAWDIEPGTYIAKPTTMTEFNMWTFNSRVFPGVDPLVVRQGDRVRIRIANMSMHDHPDPHPRVRLYGHGDRRRAGAAQRAVPGGDRQHSSGRDPRDGIRRRRIRRLAPALPQVPSHHERHGPCGAQYAGRQAS